MNLFPGKSIFSPPRPRVQAPAQDDSAERQRQAAQKKALADAKARRGRKASILTGPEGVQESPSTLG